MRSTSSQIVRASSVNAVSISPMRSSVDAEFVVASTEVLDKRVTAHDYSRRMVAFESPHWSESRFESTVVRFDPVVRVLHHVVERAWQEFIDHRA